MAPELGPGYFGLDIDNFPAPRVFHPEDSIFPAVTLPVGHAPGVSHRQGNPSYGQVPDKHGYEERGCSLLAGNL